MIPDLVQLKRDLLTAETAAGEAAALVDDGGSCCLDAVIIPTGRRHPLKSRSQKLDEIFGGRRRRIDWGWRVRGYLLTYSDGQGQKRQVAAEAAAKALAGWNAYVHYQLDWKGTYHGRTRD